MSRVLLVAAWLAAFVPGHAHSSPDSEAEDFSLHAQFTHVTQQQSAFRSPYQGDNSLTPQRVSKETTDLTLYLGARLWPGGEIYLNPEVDQGFGLSNTLGVAGFPSGEAYKVGANRAYLRLPRALVRHVVALGDEYEAVAAGANTLAGRVASDRLTVTVGKYSVSDLFDTVAYAHDPRADFMNWSVIEAGAFDYAADAWGYTHGATAEWQFANWTLRAGLFALSVTPNSTHIDKGFGQRAWIGELERRHAWLGRPGMVQLLAYSNSGRMGRYDEAVALAASERRTPTMDPVRRRASKSGWALNLQQEVLPDLGLFMRNSGSDGRYEAFDFTEINRSTSGGLVAGGALWGQPTHSWGAAFAVNGIPAAARRYFRAGGLGILIGDGQLPRYGGERIAETYYKVTLGKILALTADYQRITNPAYNRDRGPVGIVGLRLHAEI